MEFIASPNYTPAAAVSANYGRPRTFSTIVIHWWDAPANRPTIESVISRFQNPQAQVSAHYVVNDERAVQMVSEGDAAWHAMSANPFSIGIECDPNGGEAMYQRLGALVQDIRARRGDLPLAKHSLYVATQCPGTIDLVKINSYAFGGASEEEDMDNELVDLLYQAALAHTASDNDKKHYSALPVNSTELKALLRGLLGSKERKDLEAKMKGATGKALGDYSTEELFGAAVSKVLK